MPTRTTGTPSRFPRWLIRQGRLPKDKVQRIPLTRIIRIPTVFCRQAQHVRPSVTADPTELRKAGHIEIDRAARLVGVSLVQRNSHQRQNFRYGGRRTWLGGHPQQVQHAHFGVEPRHLLSRQIQIVDSHLPGLAQYVVVYVGDIADAPRHVSGILQTPLQHVEVQVNGSVTQVSRVVGGDPTGVHRDQWAGRKGHHRSSRRVEQFHRYIPAICSVECTLYRMLSVMQTAVKASMAAAWLNVPVSSGLSPGMASISPMAAPVASAWSEHTNTSASKPESRSSISEAGKW